MLRPIQGIFYGWWIVLSFFIMNFYWAGALMLGLSALFNPIRDHFGFSATLTTIAITLRFTIGALVAPIIGYALDRFGPRPLVLGATFITAAGLALVIFSDSTQSFFFGFVIAALGMSIFIAGTGPVAAAYWFIRRRGLASSLLMSGAGMGALLIPVVIWLEAGWGWRGALGVILVGLLVISIPLSLLLRHRPEQYGLNPDGDAPLTANRPGQAVGERGASRPIEPDASFGAAMSSRAFWLSSTSQALAALGGSAVTLFTIPHLEESGFSRTTAGLSTAGVGVIVVLSTLTFGWISDRLDKRKIIALSFLCQASGIAALVFASSFWHLIPFAILFGMGSRSAFSVMTSLQADYFGRTNFGKVQGIQFSIFTLGAASGPIIGAIIRDASGTYTPIFVAYIATSLVAALAISLVKRPAIRQWTT